MTTSNAELTDSEREQVRLLADRESVGSPMAIVGRLSLPLEKLSAVEEVLGVSHSEEDDNAEDVTEDGVNVADDGQVDEDDSASKPERDFAAEAATVAGPESTRPASSAAEAQAGEVTPDALREWYEQVRPVYETLGRFDGYAMPAVADLTAWYRKSKVVDVELLADGWDTYARCRCLAGDYDDVLDASYANPVTRTVYGLTNYTAEDVLMDEQLMDSTKDSGNADKWRDRTTLPLYDEIEAITLFVDIDLQDEYKERPPDPDARQCIEEVAQHFVDAFAELLGGYGDVFVLDSGGGIYVHIPPAATRPLIEPFTGDDRGRVVDELTDQFNEWLADVEADMETDVPTDGVVGVDTINHKNRQKKLILSLHKSLDVVTHPLDARDIDFEALPFTDAMAEVEATIAAATEYTEEFMADSHREHADALAAELWPDEYAEAGDAPGAVRAWLEAEREEKEEQRRRREALEAEREARGAGISGATDAPVTPYKADVSSALDALDARDVAGQTIVAGWSDDVNTSSNVRAFRPIWGPNCNGRANIVNEDVWTDTGTGDQGGVVEMALIADGGWIPGTRASGEDWWRGARLLREQHGYDIPVWIPEVGSKKGNGETYERTPLWALCKAAVALGVCYEEELAEKEVDDGAYRDLPSTPVYNQTLAELADAGIDHGREPRGDGTASESVRMKLDVGAPGEEQTDEDKVTSDLIDLLS